jgi:hypothetical protein
VSTLFPADLSNYLIPADRESLQHHLAISEYLPDWAKLHFLDSPGAFVMRGEDLLRPHADTDATRRADGACTFLSAENLCGIHSGARYGCAFFDAHQTDREADRHPPRSTDGHGCLQGLLDAAVGCPPRCRSARISPNCCQKRCKSSDRNEVW